MTKFLRLKLIGLLTVITTLILVDESKAQSCTYVDCPVQRTEIRYVDEYYDVVTYVDRVVDRITYVDDPSLCNPPPRCPECPTCREGCPKCVCSSPNPPRP